MKEKETTKNSVEELKILLEQKNRELEIEAALERVRGCSMGMNKSEELVEVVRLLDKEIAGLGVEVNGSQIVTDFANPEKSVNVWYARKGQNYLEKFHIPYLEHPLTKRVYNALQKNVDFYTENYSKAEKNKYFRLLFKYSDFGKISKQRQEFIYQSPALIRAVVVSKNSFLVFHRYEIKEFTREEEGIFKRFGKVFEQAYTRFLDLQKAETQAREAQIEASLERVRGRAMAIRKSDELKAVITLIFKELNHLGFDLLESNLMIFVPDSKDLIAWGTGPNNSDLASGTKLQYFEHPFLDQLFQDIEAGKKFRSGTIGGTQLKSYLDKLYTLTDFKNTPKELMEVNYKVEEVHYRQAIFEHGFLELIGTEPIPVEKEKIIKRFAKVIDLTYTRFDDIVQAETQAREAQIEAALERVRSRTMGMQKSSELQEVINRIFVEITGLGVTMDSSYIITHLDQDMNKGFYAWVSINEQSYASKLHQAYLDHPLVHRFYRAWNEQEPHFAATFSKAEKDRYFSHQFKYSPQLSQIPEQRKKVILDGNGWSLSWTILKNAALIIQRYQHNPFNEDEINIQKRFAKVFEQTYTRFLDLQKAEAQAKDALKQASLDRVRGEIASMRNSEDLNRITPVIWRELKALEVPFFRCGVFIFDETLEKVRVYLSTPEGKSIAALNLSFDANELTKNTVEHWRMKRIFRTHWNSLEFINWTRSMVQMGQIESEKSYQGNEQAPESLNLHFVPFRQGMLYVGDVNPLSNEKIDLVKNLAESFSIAYARYEDFKNLEEAKNKIEMTLSELKSTQAQLIHAEKMASLGELTAGIAHEIQNPLNFVNNFSELSNELIAEIEEERARNPESRDENLVSEVLSDIKQNLEKINHHGKRAADIVKGMLQHSRTGSGQKESTDINALADEYLRLAYHGLKAKDKSFNADFKTEFDPNLPLINVIPQDIGRVLLNLINNAFYAVSKEAETSKDENYKPTVKVATSYSPLQGGKGGVEIRVQDNGPGIPSEIKDKIFQPFFTTKPTGQGTGLGLSLSYDIVKAHGGEIKIETKTDKARQNDPVGWGTIFTIKIPVNA
jgi:signal transduction histidine kinase